MEDDALTTWPDPHAPRAAPTEQSTYPGILVFTTSLQLLYMNGAARAFCGQLTTQRTGLVVHGVVPTEVLELCDEIVKALAARADLKDWEQFQLERVVGNSGRPVLLRGLGLPDAGGFSQSRLLVLMEEMGQPRTSTARRAKDRFNLTDREQTVIIYLLKGLTNKEIASRMMVSEQTVKEHLRHIMQKTDTTTRTGILAKVILNDPDLGSQPYSSPPGPV